MSELSDKVRKVVSDAAADPQAYIPGEPTVVVISGGAVQDVINVPPGVEIVIKDYDVNDCSAPEDVDDEAIYADPDGYRYELLGPW